MAEKKENGPVEETEVKAINKNPEAQVPLEIEQMQEAETKTVESAQGEETVKEMSGEKIPETENEEDHLSSLDMLWGNAFYELDEWAAHANSRDDSFLKEAMYYVESLKRNQGNLKAVKEQFNKEFLDWEKAAREEFLMATTSLQHFFPLKSYEEMNEQVDSIQQKIIPILSAPCRVVTNNQALDKYLEMIEQYISLRKKGRAQYIKMIKQTANFVYENQKGFVNLFARQIRTLLFPFNKYLEKTEETVKS